MIYARRGLNRIKRISKTLDNNNKDTTIHENTKQKGGNGRSNFACVLLVKVL